MAIRVSYNPNTKIFISGGLSHADDIRQADSVLSFDDYIRGIIIDNILYLRTYYPYQNINEKTCNEIKAISFDLLYDIKDIIQAKIFAVLNIKTASIIYNADNDLFKGLKLANI